MMRWDLCVGIVIWWCSLQVGGTACPGSVNVEGHGLVSIIPTGWHSPDGGAALDVLDRNTLVAHMGARGYFADTCTAGAYSNEQYMALKLLGKTLSFTTDLSGAGCGCNAAFYLVSMRQNTQPSTCGDFYCDANKVCGVSCAEIDIMEANQQSWHSTLHTAHDHNGLGSGYGGGDGYDGPRDFDSSQYAPGGTCIDTTKPFQVSVSFPLDSQGALQAMEVTLSQDGKSCPLTARVSGYAGMAELTKALAAGMTPTVSYWSSEAMLWMDGKGADGRGPCTSDTPSACAATVKFYDFKLENADPTAAAAPSIASASSEAAVAAFPPVATVPPSTAAANCPGNIRVHGLDTVAVVPTGWKSEDMVPITVPDSRTLVPHMGSRGYFASECTAGTYSNEQYLALNLLGKTLRFTVNLAGAGCGCNAALYLVSMHQNQQPSECSDYYCDANNVCGASCAEIDIMEANQYAWHSTLHTSQDHNGKGGGYGGGFGYNGPRDWTGSEYGPGGSCIDTNKPFNVTASFPVTTSGDLAAMDVELTQVGHSCQVKTRVSDYDGMLEVSQALRAGMTPVMSYWSSDDMLWMDGKGSDGQGPCAGDDAASCSDAVTFFGFSVEEHKQDSAGPPGNSDSADVAEASRPHCPGSIGVSGLGNVSIVPTGWKNDGTDNGAAIDVHSNSGSLVPHMGARGYFATTCTAGMYNHEHYMALKLLGKTMEFDVDLSGADCGCNAAFYLVSMRQNPQPSNCGDYYCDANNVCGVSCAEIDIMEANKLSWHSTLHTSHDHNGLGGGYGGGDGYNGPRDWTGSQYAPGGSCIDTSKGFHVAVSFPTDNQGALQAMEVTLSQVGHSCSVSTRVSNYPGMVELTAALSNGMTPVFSYWGSDDMLWMDGKGTDGQGPCARDSPSKCSDTVRMEHFTVRDIGGEVVTQRPRVKPVFPPAAWPSNQLNTTKPEVFPAKATPAPAPVPHSENCPGAISVAGHGQVSIVPTGWKTKNGGAAFDVAGDALVPHMGARAYFADSCTPSAYNHSQYQALNLLGDTISFEVDLSGTGCGCNVAFYLVSMRQNTQPSECHDYYCDANNVCGESCAEIDIMEANQFSWHSTLHTAQDHNGVGGGYGGGDGYNGPRDWTSSRYAPHSHCIDTSKPVRVAASFPVDEEHGNLLAMEVTISQEGHNCSVMSRVSDYKGMSELSAALAAGMTPVVSYWSSDSMLWMDGRGTDGKGPCKRDDAAACPASVRFSRFAVTRAHKASLRSEQLTGGGSASAPTTTTQKMYFAGQEEEAGPPSTKAASGDDHGAFELLTEAADLILAAANHASTSKGPSSSSTFDCSAGRKEWELGWSQMKKAHCCHEVNIPCPQTDGLPVPQATTTPATIQATTPLFVVPSAQTEVSQGQETCAAAYQQCGGRNWLGSTCCYDGCTCKGFSKYYSQCVPDVAGGTCVAPSAETAIFMRKDSISNSKRVLDGIEVRRSNCWLLVSTYAMAFSMTALVAVTVHRRLRARVQADGEGTASAGDPDPELPAMPHQFFQPTLRTAKGNEPLEFLDIDLPLCQERLFQRRPLGQESHRCVPMALVNQGDSPRQLDEAAEISLSDDRGDLLHALTRRG